MNRYIVPLIIFFVLSGFLYVGLSLKPREVPSPYIDKPAPEFKLQKLHAMEEQFSIKENIGKVWLLNVWASWCVACRAEHPVLIEMARTSDIPLYGLNYKDVPTQARRWLDQHGGDPYELSVVDYEGNVGIDYGVYGVPETFVIDKQGVIRHKVIGPLNFNEVELCVKPVVAELRKTEGPVDMVSIKEARKACSNKA